MQAKLSSRRSRFLSALLTAALSLSLLTAAIADGPGGLGKLPPPCEATLQSDGSRIYSNGTILYSDGHVLWSDANHTIWYPTVQQDGSWLYPDGTIIYPDMTIWYPPDN